MIDNNAGTKLNFEEGAVKLMVNIKSDNTSTESVSNDPHVIALQRRVTALEKQLIDMQAVMSCKFQLNGEFRGIVSI